jgi:cellulose synthase/poly-beta-1,6-N-acetylglucosamine synthase-like glycosyltransferase
MNRSKEIGMERRQPFYLLLKNPRAWMSASLPKFMISAQEVMAGTSLTHRELEAMPWSQRHDYLHLQVLHQQERRWEEEVGVKPADSHFTLIVPIYNEEDSLPSFLGTLMLADIPSSLDMNIVFVTNACSDASCTLIREFLSLLGEVESRPLPDAYRDKNLHATCTVVRQGGLSFIHVDTQTVGKANALHIGNCIARQCGHVIAMSLDANNYLEPDALRVLFACAHASFRSKLQIHDTVLLSGIYKNVMKTSKLKSLLDRVSGMRLHLIEVGSVVTGCVMAWNTVWMESIGGPPEVALEDYAMGVLARAHDYKIAQASGAIVWGYNANDLKGLLDTRARYVRGILQLLKLADRDPSILSIVEQEAFYMKEFPGRLKYLLQRSKESPLNFPKYVATFCLWECALYRGKRAYKRNPTNPSWKKIASTY